MHNGYIKLFRKFIETSFFTNSACVHLAIYFLLKCNHEEKKIVFNGKELIIKKGQCITGLHETMVKTGLSIQQIRTAKKTLENIKFLTSKSTNKFSIICIDNYKDYQGNDNKQTNKPITSQQQTNNKPITTNKHYKNDKNEKNTTIGDKIAKVNWDNCKTPQQLIMRFWVKNYLPALYVGYTNGEYKAFITKHGKAITGILNQCRGDVELAYKAIKMTGNNLSGKGLDWTLFAVDRNCSDYVNEIRRKQNAYTNRP